MDGRDADQVRPLLSEGLHERGSAPALLFEPVSDGRSGRVVLRDAERDEQRAVGRAHTRTFHVKAFRLFTGHQTERKFFPPDIQPHLPQNDKKNLYYGDVPPDIIDEMWRRFFEAIEPLRTAGKLGAVLFQFAPWISTAPRDKAHVKLCADRMASYLAAFEFRNVNWFDERHRESTLAFERERGLVHVVMDAPEGVPNRAHTVWEATSPELVIVRMHGRNAETWIGSTTAAGRFNYDYSERELDEIAVPVREIAKRSGRTHVVFNNCFEDSAQRNAHSMIRILQQERFA